MKKQFSIEGMHCVSCANIITKKLSAVSGVQSCDVNVATRQASIEYNDADITPEDMSQELKKYGYILHDITVIEAPSTDTSADISHDHHSGSTNTHDKTEQNNIAISIPLVSLSIGIMIWMIGVDYQWRSKSEIISDFFHHLLPVFATIMLTVVGWKYIVAVGRYTRYGVANMDTLVGIGTLTAFLYSFIISAFETSLDPYLDVHRGFYEAVIVVIGFIELGKYMESRVMKKTGQAIKALLGLQVKNALIVKNGNETQVPIGQVIVGDIMIVKPGEKIPLDGTIIKGSAFVDESMITGEAYPVQKDVTDTVIGSTIVQESALFIQATAVGADTYLHKIITIVQQAQNSKPSIQRLADRIMEYFVPVVLLIAICSGLFWLFLGQMFFPEINPIQFAVMSFVGVLVIACPCGLGLATPMAVITGIGHGAKNGILAKNAEGLLKLRTSKYIVFDKTGTLTEGKPTLVEIHQESDTTLSILASLESLSSHPIAKAICDYANKHHIATHEVQQFKNLVGIGLTGIVDEILYTVCNPAYIEQLGLAYDTQRIQQRTKQGKTPILLISDKKILGYYAVADTIKQTTHEAISQIKSLGMIPIMLTGDHKNTAHYVASQLGIDRVYAEVKPEEKAAIIHKIKQEGVVAMVGDGINDAPALATADIGIAMSTGTDIAIEAAALTLLHGDLSKLVKAIKISRLTHAAILQNLVRAFGFNLIGIPLAGGVFYPVLGVLLNPAFEGAAMAFSNLTVVGNSLRLQAKTI